MTYSMIMYFYYKYYLILISYQAESKVGTDDKRIQYFYGIGTETIQNRLNRSKQQQKQNPKFLNKAPLGTKDGKRKMEQHQSDLVNLSKIAVTIDEIEYKYVLLVMDIFSRFLWL